MTPNEAAPELDALLLEELEEDLLALLFAAPALPRFAADTVRPGKPS